MPPFGRNPARPPPGASELERLKSHVANYFPVYETRVTPNSLVLMVQADPATLGEKFDRLRRELWDELYVVGIRREGAEYLVEVVRRPQRRPYGIWVNVGLLIATIVSTAAAGAFLWLAYRGGISLASSDFLFGGLFFALPLLAILGLHELAHFVVARAHHVEASLPYFVPVPPPFLLFGTFGAFISLREPIPDKRTLLDVGASGPLAGFVVAVPVTIAGMFLSIHAPTIPITNCGPTILGVSYGNLLFGTSFFWYLLHFLLPLAFTNLHPLALAGWVGLLVTAINLLPAGQLDGGHVFRALLGDRAVYVSWAAFFLLLALGAFFYTGWFVFALLIFVLGVRHPPPLNDITPLDAKRWVVGGVAATILVAGFVTVPIAQPTGEFSITQAHSAKLLPPPGYGVADSMAFFVVDQDLIAHGFLVSGTVTGAIVANGTGTETLSSTTTPTLAQYAANSSWMITLPNGNVTYANGTGSFALPASQYLALDAGARGSVGVVYLNRGPGTVFVSLTVSVVCPTGGVGGAGTNFQLN